MPAITPGTSLHKLVNTIAEAIGTVFSQALGATWQVAIQSNDKSVADTSKPSLCFQFALSGGLQGTAVIQAQTQDALLWASSFLAEPVDPSAKLRPDHKEALQELLRQVAGTVATGIKGTWGETKIEVEPCESPSWEGVALTLLAAENSAGTRPLQVRLSSELLASLSSSPNTASLVPTKSEEKASPSASSEPNFDLLLGVDLNLTLRFGRSVMSLRELLDLNSGSVIELDREVNEPADLLLGNKLIARGEVVIVDGNYGIRVTEIADPRQRLNSI
jgi:flagellar motor switch protein FliN